jgi:UrcA family protein
MRHLMAAFAVLALGTGTSAAAEDTIVVKYKDLNLASEEGQKALDKRIDSAARNFCRFNSLQTGTRNTKRAQTECVDQARAAARAQVLALTDGAARKGG